jgi:hypothetical protein
MSLNFTIDDFLNDFAAGFVFILALIYSNFEKFHAFMKIFNEYTTIPTSLIFVFLTYILGIAISSFFYFIDWVIFKKIDNTFKKKYTNPIIKAVILSLLCIPWATLYILFRRWSVIDTFRRLIDKAKMPGTLRHFKTPEQVMIIAEKLNTKLGSGVMRFFYKAQFWQYVTNAILSILLIDFFVFKSPFLLSQSIIVLLVVYIIGKFMSPMHAYNFALEISRIMLTLPQYEQLDENIPSIEQQGNKDEKKEIN